jgi:hypothetical protein
MFNFQKYCGQPARHVAAKPTSPMHATPEYLLKYAIQTEAPHSVTPDACHPVYALSRVAPEIQMEILYHILLKSESDYAQEMNSPEPSGGYSFRSRAERLVRPYALAYPPIETIWQDNKSLILRRVATDQLQALLGWHRATRRKYIRARMRFVLWRHFSEQVS